MNWLLLPLLLFLTACRSQSTRTEQPQTSDVETMPSVTVELENLAPMRLVSEFFVATPQQLPPAFPGWLLPLPQPVRRRLHNPFTGEPMSLSSGEPYFVETVAPEGPWGDVHCPNLSSFPHADLSPIGQLEIDSLAEVVAPHPKPTVPVLFASPSSGWNLAGLSTQFTQAIADVRSPQKVGKTWAAALHSDPNVDSEQLDAIDLSDVIVLLQRLAQQAVSQNYRLYVYEGPQPPT